MTALPSLAVGALAVAYLPLALALSITDVREHRLPNRLVAALTAAVGLVLLATAATVPATRSLCLGALALALLIGLLGIAVALLAPDLLGMGDAKTAPAVAAVACALGWDVLLGALLGCALLGGAVAAAVMIRSRSARTRMAYGPVLLSSPLLGLLLAPVVRAALGV